MVVVLATRAGVHEAANLRGEIVVAATYAAFGSIMATSTTNPNAKIQPPTHSYQRICAKRALLYRSPMPNPATVSAYCATCPPTITAYWATLCRTAL
jgi:hypothetical protein